MIPTTFPEVLDSTMITTYRACPHKFFREYCQHWKSPGNVHLHAGASFAKGLEASRLSYWRDGKSASDSYEDGIGAMLKAYGTFECPEESPKSATRMAGALEFYYDRYPFPNEEAPPHMIEHIGPAVEFNFAEPLSILHPDTGNPLILCGRFDQIVDYAGGVWGEDDKTASQLGATWPKQWDMRFQFSTYSWGARKAGFPLQGFLVRGVSILKKGYDTLQAITYRPAWMLDRWEAGMLTTVEKMVEDWKWYQGHGMDAFTLNEGDACNAYGGCPLRITCLSANPEPWLATSFVQRVWNPLTRGEEGEPT